MDLEAVKQFLATDEGKSLIETSESTVGLRTKKDELLSKNVQLTNQLKAFEGLGDVDTIRKALEIYTKSQEEVKNKQDVAPQVDPKLVAQLEHLQKELENERGVRTKREQAMITTFADAEITSAIARSKGIPELLKHVVQSRVEATLKEDGKIGITIKNSDGSPMFKNGKEASLDDLLSEIKANAVYGRAFDADPVQGSGARQTVTKKAGVTTDMNDAGFNLSELMKKQKKA